MANYDRNSDSQVYWNEEGGSKWIQYMGLLENTLVPMSEQLLDKAAARQGEHILDVGCGGGLTSIKLAQQAGPQGSVLGVDVSEPILAIAIERGEKIANLSFRQCDAGTADLGENCFDLVTSRFGVMFFDDPVQAFSNLHRSMKDSGRLVFICWRGVDENPWLGEPVAEAFTILPPPPEKPDPTAPGPFSLGDAEHLRSVLESAGFRQLNLQAVDREMSLGQLDDAVSFLMKMGPAAEALNEASEAEREQVEQAVRKVMAKYEGEEGILCPGATWLVSASK